MERKYIPLKYSEVSNSFRVSEGILERWYRGCYWREVGLTFNESSNYYTVRWNEHKIPLHRILWVLGNKEDIPYGLQVDHIDGNTKNNSIDNLRLVTNRENGQNKFSHRNGKLAGAYYHSFSGLWQSNININGKIVGIGYHKTEQEAHEAYMIACEMLDKFVDNASFRNLVKNRINNMEVAV